MFLHHHEDFTTEVKPLFRYVISAMVIFALMYPAAHRYFENQDAGVGLPGWFNYFIFGMAVFLGTLINSSEKHKTIKSCVVGAAGVPGMLYAVGLTAFNVGA